MKRFVFSRFPLVLLLPLGVLVLSVGPTAACGASPTTHPSGDAIVQYVNQLIDWYRQVQALEPSSGDSHEILLRTTVMQNAGRAVPLAFRFARAAAASRDADSKSADPAASRAGKIAQAVQAAAQRAAQFQAQLDQLDKQIEAAPANARDAIYAHRYELTAQLNLANTQRDIMEEYALFVVSSGSSDSAGLSQKIDDLERSAPELLPGTNRAPTTAPATAVPQFHPETVGIFGLVSEMLRLSGRMSEISRLASQAADLRTAADRFRAPLGDAVADTMRSADDIAAASRPATDDPRALETRGMQIDQFTDRFKQLSAISIPLAEQSMVIDFTREGLLEWRDGIGRQYSSALHALLLRLATMLGVILVVFAISEVWRRATFKYVSDARRQRQLVLVRRLVVGAVVLIIIVASVVSEFGSLATFAGLITAGVAVALQTVILSGVAYFFMIGRFGVRVGDRVTINNITGDVIEIGLFRIYLMELSGGRADLQATGRVVVFSNSVLFQPSAFYKQLPGSDYIWHEVAVTLAADSDPGISENRLLEAVNSVFGEYQQAVEAQHQQISKSLHVDMGAAHPQGRLRFVDSGLEFVVRYPVEIHQAAKIDERITRELLKAINQEPKLKIASAGTPKIRPA